MVSAIAPNCKPGSDNPKKGTPTPLEQNFDPGTQHFAFAIGPLKPVKGVPGSGLSAKDCGACHTDIHRDWKTSTHSRALSDPQFQAEITKPDNPKWLCLNCHIPLVNQRRFPVTHLYDNNVLKPVKKENRKMDSALRSEGVTCAVCHVRPDNTGNSVIIGAFPTDKAPHPVRVDKKFLNNICQRCHQPVGEAIAENLVCWFETKKELEKALSAKTGFAHTSLPEQKTCVTCHMPSPAEKKRLVPAWKHLPKRLVHRHLWTGGGIPKEYSLFDSLRQRGYKPGVALTLKSHKIDTKKSMVNLELAIRNLGTGHLFPTGDPERHLLIVARLFVPGQVKPVAEIRHRIGQTWEWSPARKIADNRLKNGETRQWRGELKWDPVQVTGKLVRQGRLEIDGIHVRMTSDIMGYMKKAAPKIDEDLLPGGRELIARAEEIYPMAVWLYRSEINLKNGQARVAPLKELIEISKQQRRLPLTKRLY